MTPEAQRIAIAEACGWTCCGQVSGHPPHGLHPGRNVSDYTTKQVLDGDVPIEDLPDYLNDLNAMHEAEKTLLPFTSQPWQGYVFWLSHLTELGGQDHAPADQRAEAFLRTIGKWIDTERSEG